MVKNRVFLCEKCGFFGKKGIDLQAPSYFMLLESKREPLIFALNKREVVRKWVVQYGSSDGWIA